MSDTAATSASNHSPIVVLVEWQATGMNPTQAKEMARDALAVLRAVPGLDEARIFGDFESGTHCFLLTWHDEESMERYMSSEVMQTVRGAALPFVEGMPSRRIFLDYGAASHTAVAPDG